MRFGKYICENDTIILINKYDSFIGVRNFISLKNK